MTIPQEIREQCGLLPHTEVRFVVDNGRVWIERQAQEPSRASDAQQRLRRDRLHSRPSTDALLALTRGEASDWWCSWIPMGSWRLASCISFQQGTLSPIGQQVIRASQASALAKPEDQLPGLESSRVGATE